MGNAGYVGRVGALAVALGVGGAMLASPAVASADGGRDRASADDTARETPATASGPTVGGRGSGKAHRTAVPAQKNRSTAATPDRVAELPAVTPSGPVRSVADDTVPAAAPAAAETPAAAAVVAEAPAVAAVPRGALAVSADGLLDRLGGSDGSGVPLATPLTWAVVAVTRREFDSATMNIGSTAVPTAAASGDLAGLATALGSRVAGALTTIAGNLSGAAGATLVDFLAQSTAVPGVSVGDAVGIAAANLLRDAAGITRVAVPAFDSLNPTVIAAIGAALSDPALAPGLGSAASDLIIELAGSPAVRTLVAEQLTRWVSSISGGSSLAGAVGDAAAALLASPAVASGLAAVAESAITGVFGQPALSAVLAGAVGPVIDAALGGGDFADTAMAVFDTVQSDPAAVAALRIALRNTLATAGDVLAGSEVRQALGRTTANLFTALAADPSLRAELVDQFSAVLGSQVGTLIGDPRIAGDVAAAVGSAVTGLLGQPGLVAALTGAAGQVFDAVLAGADPQAAVQSVFAALQADRAVAAAAGATVSAFVESVMKSAGVLDVVGGVTQNMVDTALGQAGLAATPIAAVAKAAVSALLTNSAVADLAGDITTNLLSGKPVDAVANTVIRAVITEPDLQAAVGTAVGQAIGTIFGDNPIGEFVGWVAGGAATVAIGFLAGIALLFNLVPAPAAVVRNDWPVVAVVA